MPALDSVLQQKLQLLEAKHQRRRLRLVSRAQGAAVDAGGKSLISFTSNDYLGLSTHPEVIEAAVKATQKYGAGAGASRLAGGNFALYEELESLLAAIKGTQSACVFGSGYLANFGTIPALVGPGDLIIADKLSHACTLDAARLSGATFMRFAHNNISHCRMLLEANRAEHHHCLILTETVFSMDGDKAPVAELSALAKEYDGWLLTDSAHDLFTSSPIRGEVRRGAKSGAAEQESPHPNPPPIGEGVIQMGTLSKAAGSYGGYVCGSHTLADYLKTAARSLIYSTALPPATIAASIAALNIIRREPGLGEKALANARLFTSLLGIGEAQSAIVPVILQESEKAIKASQLLEEEGFLVSAIRPPTVPENTSRLRFAFTVQHEKSDIERLCSIIKAQGWV